jgi:hypothetical protein
VCKQLKFLPPGKDKDPNMHMNMRRMLVPRLPPVIKTYENSPKQNQTLHPGSYFYRYTIYT